MICTLCGRRKARRACPALGRDICAVCCGTKRLVEIRCPDTCVHLASARQHPPAIEQRRQARDAGVLIPVLRDLTRGQQELLFMLFGLMLQQDLQDPLQPLRDDDVAEAAAALAATYETAARGVIYEHRPQSLPAQRVMTAVRGALDEIAQKVGRGLSDVDAPRSLRALERAARSSAAVLGDERPTAFVELAGRVIAPLARASEEDSRKADLADPGPGLIIPGA